METTEVPETAEVQELPDTYETPVAGVPAVVKPPGYMYEGEGEFAEVMVKLVPETQLS